MTIDEYFSLTISDKVYYKGKKHDITALVFNPISFNYTIQLLGVGFLNPLLDDIQIPPPLPSELQEIKNHIQNKIERVRQ